MRKFKKAQRLPHDWATLALQLRKFQTTQDNLAKSEHGQQALDALAPFSEQAQPLRELATYIISRSH